MVKIVSIAAATLAALILSGCTAIPGTSQDAAAPAATPSIVAQQPGAHLAVDSATSRPTQSMAHAPTLTSTIPAKVSPTIVRPTATASPSVTSSATATAAPTPVILGPVHLGEAEVGGSKLFARYWTNTRAIVFSMAPPPGSAVGLRPEVEVQLLARPFSGVATAEGALIQPGQSGSVVVQVASLPEGAYHWQARFADDQGHVGPWAIYYEGPAFRLDRTPPDAPTISSQTDPVQTVTYGSPMAELSWTAAHDNGEIQGYQTGVDRKIDGFPSGAISAATRTAIGPLADGKIYFHVRAIDWAGNIGKTATYLLNIDHRPPVLTHAFFDQFQFNPQFDRLTMHFIPDKTVQITAYVRRQSTKGIVRMITMGQKPAGKQVNVSWDGRNARGVLVNAGKYTLEIYAKDALGNVGDAIYSGLTVNFRRIVIHLATQQLDAYDGDTLLRSSLVTTGNQHLPTPVGIWHVGAKFHPYKFLSPWPKTSPFWYPTSAVNYALYFHSGGYFIHDAPWRTVFGPGTNTSPGLPGSGIYAGSHGCVETPTDFVTWLYAWAPIGTVVDVVQ